MYNKKVAKVAFWFIFVGFNTLYFPMLIMGWLGMPRRYYDYLPQFHPYHLVSTIGSWIIITGIFLMFFNLIRALKKGPVVTERNIWGGETLEWKIETPPIHENFTEIPYIETGPYEYKDNELAFEKEKTV